MSIEDNPNIEEKSIVDDWKDKFTNSKDFKKYIGKAIKNMNKDEHLVLFYFNYHLINKLPK